MKKKIYFLCSAVSQIILSTLAIIHADKFIAGFIDQLSIYPDNMQERMRNLYTNSGHIFIFILAFIAIILNGFILYWAIDDKLLKYKKKVIGCSIYSILMAFYPISELIAIVNIIVIACCKRQSKNDYPDDVEEMPVLKKENVNTKKIALAVILILVYFSYFILGNLIHVNENIAPYIAISFYLLMIVLSIIFFKDLLDNNFKMFRTNFKAYYQNLIGKVGIYYLVYLGVAMVVAFILRDATSANQQAGEELPILLSVPLAILYAPLVEETIFRGCIRRFIKNDKVFIIVSGIAFGLVHTIFSESSILTAIIQAIPYATMGGFLAYLYVKTNNICTNMAFHAFHNTLAVIVTILIKGI